MLISIIDGIEKTRKFLPSDGGVLRFDTVKTETNFQIYQIVVNNFVLYLPLTHGTIFLERKFQTLKRFSNNVFHYIILDIETSSKFFQDKILNYFSNYRSIIGRARSYDGYTNFNLKGLLFCEEVDYTGLKKIHAQVANDIKEWGILTQNVVKYPYYSAPSLNSDFLMNIENKKPFREPNIKLSDFMQKPQIELNLDSSNVTEDCKEVFTNLGFVLLGQNYNGSFKYKFKDDETYFWYANNPYIMNHKDITKCINIFHLIKKTEKAQDIFKPFENGDPINEKFILTKDKTDIIGETVIKEKSAVFIKSAMGTGKSELIRSAVEIAQNNGKRILIITNRRTVANDYYQKYQNIDGVELYSNKNKNKSKVFICQYDSLYKIHPSEYDIVVLDEFVSLLLYSKNNPTKKIKNFEIFDELLNKKSLIVADAFLSEMSEKMIPQKSNIFKIVNNYRDSAELYRLNSIQDLFQALLENITVIKNTKQKITVSVTSNVFLYALEKLFQDCGLKTKILIADLEKKDKDFIYKNMQDQNHDNWDVLLYSPVLTVGVSNMNDVLSHFHIDTAKTVDVISSLQMVKRTRKAQKYYTYVEDKKENKPINLDFLKRNLILNTDPTAEECSLTDTNRFGETILKHIAELSLKIDVLKNALARSHQESFYTLILNNFNDIEIYKPLNVVEIDVPKYIKYGSDQAKNKIDYKDFEEFFNNLGINLNVEKTSKIQKFINLVYENSRLDIINKEEDREIFKEIVLNASSNMRFISECRNYNILKKRLNRSDLQGLMQNNINNSERYDFLMAILSAGFVLENKTYDDTNKKVNFILSKSGFVLKNHFFNLKPEIEKYSKFLILD